MGLLDAVLYTLLTLLTVDGIIELSLIAATVAHLHATSDHTYYNIASIPSLDVPVSWPLAAKPANLNVNQGHLANGAAGTAIVLVGLGGAVVLWLRSRNRSGWRKVHLVWLAVVVAETLLVLAALVYNFALWRQSMEQQVDVYAAYANYYGKPYPRDEWTPETWYAALLDIDFVREDERNRVVKFLRIKQGWRWNLIPMFVLALGMSAVAVMDFRGRRDGGRYVGADVDLVRVGKARRRAGSDRKSDY